MALHAQAGDVVQPVILAEGVTSRDASRDRAKREAELSSLAECAKRASEIIGVEAPIMKDFPDNRMDGVERLEVTHVIEEIMASFKPDIVYSHHAGDVNIDHRVIHEALIPATRPLPGSNLQSLLFFEVASSTEWQPPHSAVPFTPNWFVDIGAALELKLKALEAYESEMRPWPHPRSLKAVEHLARWRGSTIGVEAAEAFVLGRHCAGGNR